MNEPFVHPSSIVDRPCQIGEGTKIWHFCHISAGATIGKHCSLGQNIYVGPRVSLGDRVRVQNNVSLYEGVTCEEDVFLGPSVVFTNVQRPRAAVSRKHLFAPTHLRRGVTIGANATILCGVTIGEYAFVGAGSVLTQSLPAYTLAYGNPARVRGFVCRCGEKLALSLHAAPTTSVVCQHCDAAYQKTAESIAPV
jgi:UDP-2-acetamido-3-amino-2,3-dideoxy-glucuronate N-acetyltransferase